MSTSILTFPRRVLAVVVLASLGLAIIGPFSGTAIAAPAAAYTSTNPGVDDPNNDTELCKNGGNAATNCNIYTEREFVWLDGGPAAAQLDDGTYFFAVLNPSGQNDPMGPELLSSDDLSERTFTVTGGALSYLGSHDFDSNKIRLIPFADSANGVYILAICALVNGQAEDCKFDAFKVAGTDDPDPVDVSAIFAGAKWRDDNQDGVFDANEEPLESWDIQIYSVDGLGVWTLLTTETTLVDGTYFFQSAAVPQGTAERFAVCEVQQDGWEQTAPVQVTYDAADASATNGANVAAITDTNGDACYDVTTDGSGNATASLLDFGNIPTGDLSGAKYFDGDSSGLRNDDGAGGWTEVGIAAWPIQVLDDQNAVVCATTTDVDGNWSCPDLDPGTYTVQEVQATNTSVWQQTGNTAYQGAANPNVAGPTSFVYTVTVPNDAPSTTDTLFFGNVCLSSSQPGGRTLGFWSNKNGQALITQADIDKLVSLNLVRANGTAFDPDNKMQVKNWLLNATATNMAYMLSAQLTATVLSKRHGLTDGSAQIDAAGTTVAQIIAQANAALGADGFTPSGDPNRATQAALKNILDKINNNGIFTWVVDDPTDCAAPVFP